MCSPTAIAPRTSRSPANGRSARAQWAMRLSQRSRNPEIMPRSPKIIIRRAEPRDAEAMQAIFASPRAMAGTLQLPYPSGAMWVKRIADFPPDDVLLVAEVGGVVVGNLGLHAAAK